MYQYLATKKAGFTSEWDYNYQPMDIYLDGEQGWAEPNQ